MKIKEAIESAYDLLISGVYDDRDKSSVLKALREAKEELNNAIPVYSSDKMLKTESKWHHIPLKRDKHKGILLEIEPFDSSISESLLTYSENNIDPKKFSGFHHMKFFSKEAAEFWILQNKENIYWHRITDIKPKSKKAKIIISHELGDEWKKEEGTLQTFFETGMECFGLILQKDEPRGALNPFFNSNIEESKSNFKYYHSYEGIRFIENNSILEVDGVKYLMLKDPDFEKADGYSLSFYPVGFSREELIKLFMPEDKKAILWTLKSKNERIL